MATRKIYFCGEPILRKKAKRVRQVDDELVKLLDDMAETLREAPGIGLAAPQVGESVRAIVIGEVGEDDEKMVIHKLINPRIVEAEGEVEGSEGCLSLPTLQGLVLRPQQVVVEALGPDEEPVSIEAEGWTARALCHEIDHLNGKLFIDRAEPDSLAWMIPDEDDERGYRLQSVSLAETLAMFQRLVEKARAEN